MDLKSATGSVLGPVFTFVISAQTGGISFRNKYMQMAGVCFLQRFNLVTRRLALSYIHFTIPRFTD